MSSADFVFFSKFMSQNGNDKVRQKYEVNVPMAYKRPKKNDPQ